MKRHHLYKAHIHVKTRVDPKVMPVTGETAEERLSGSLPLFGTPGEQYVERRGIPVGIAHDAGVRFDPDWNGRAAVIVPMMGANGELCSVHGRYLQQRGDEDKMFTIGPGDGILNVADGLAGDVLIIVEGLFDVLSLALSGYRSIATVGRIATWLPEACKRKTVLLAFDGNRPGEATAEFYHQYLNGAVAHRLTPPDGAKDWNTALVKRGRSIVERWLRLNVSRFAASNSINHEHA
jgi:hypothetical protein